MLESSLPDASIAEAGSIGELSAYGTDLQLQLILLDIELPGLNGLAGLAILRKRWPGVPVLVLTSHTEIEVRESALLQGVDGFLSKAESAANMLTCIRGLLAGRTETEARATPNAVNGSSVHLTPRQCEVLDLLCQGMTNKVIGMRLGLSENTVRGHVQGLLATLEVASRAEAVIVARSLGLVR